MRAPLPISESERLANLQDHCILDTPPTDEFDGLVRLAAYVCGVPIAAVSLIDEHRQWFKAITGLVVDETPRDFSFCAHTILQEGAMVVPDTREDSRFSDNPFVSGEPGVRFYAGVPLISQDGYALGSLCVIDSTPRDLTPEQKEALSLLARQAASQLTATRRAAQMERLIVEAQRSEAALHTERDFQRALLDSLQEGIIACDAQGAITLYNHATTDIHALPESVSPREWGEYFDLCLADGMTPIKPPDLPLFSALNGNIIRDLEVVVTPRMGEARIVRVNGQPITGEHGENLGAVVALHDITERRQADRDMARLAAIVESSEDAIIAATTSGLITAWNKGAEQVYGYLESEMIGRHISALTKNNEKGFMEEIVADLTRGNVIALKEVVRERKDGTVVNVSLAFSPIKNKRGEVTGISCISRDITDRKRTEAALTESEARMRRLSEAAFEGIAVSQQGMVVDASAAFAAEFGYDDPAEMIGLSALELASPESYEMIAHKVSTDDEHPYEAVLRRRDGSTFLAELRGRSTQYRGQAARITAVRNVTHQKKLEQELREREASLRAVLESAPVIVYTADIDGKILFSEGTGLATLNMKSEDVVGRSVFELIGDDTTAAANTRRVLAGEEVSFDVEFHGVCLHTELRPVRGAAGELAGFIGVCFDVTERVASEERFRVLFEQSSHAHVIFDETDGIIDCNAAALR